MGKGPKRDVTIRPAERHWSVTLTDGSVEPVTAPSADIANGGTLVFLDEAGGVMLAFSAHYWANVSAQ